MQRTEDSHAEVKMRDPKNVIWGLFLILIGVLLLLERLHVLIVPAGTLWPIVFIALAANSAVERKASATIMFLALGLMFLGVGLGWFGLTFHTAWPLLMVAAGLGMLINALTAPRRHGADEVTHE